MNDMILLYKYVHSLAVLADVEFSVTNHWVSVNNGVVERKTGSDLFDSYSLGIALNDKGINTCHWAFVVVISFV